MTEPEDDHEKWMYLALLEADKAAARDEVPIGAVIVQDGQVVGSGYNRTISNNDPTAHAEIQAIREAAAGLANYRLPHCSLYVTIEPCSMCAGAIVHGRLKQVVFGAREPKAGVVCSHGSFFDDPYLNHRVAVQEGVLAQACSEKLQTFFRSKRLAK